MATCLVLAHYQAQQEMPPGAAGQRRQPTAAMILIGAAASRVASRRVRRRRTRWMPATEHTTTWPHPPHPKHSPKVRKLSLVRHYFTPAVDTWPVSCLRLEFREFFREICGGSTFRAISHFILALAAPYPSRHRPSDAATYRRKSSARARVRNGTPGRQRDRSVNVEPGHARAAPRLSVARAAVAHAIMPAQCAHTLSIFREISHPFTCVLESCYTI